MIPLRHKRNIYRSCNGTSVYKVLPNHDYIEIYTNNVMKDFQILKRNYGTEPRDFNNRKLYKIIRKSEFVKKYRLTLKELRK